MCQEAPPVLFFCSESVSQCKEKGAFFIAVLLWCSWGLCRNRRGAVRASPAEPVVPPPASSPGAGSLLVHPRGANAGKLKWQEMGLEHHQNWDFLIPRKLMLSIPTLALEAGCGSAAPSAAGPWVRVQAVLGGLQGSLWHEDVKAFPNVPRHSQHPLLLQYAQEDQKPL